MAMSLAQAARKAVPPVALLGVLTAIDAMAIDSYIPALPQISSDLQASAAEGQATLAVFLAGVALGQACWGPVSDRIGRRVPLFLGLVLFCAASLLCSVANSLELLLVARFLQAIGASSGLVLGRAIVSDLWPADEASRLYSVMMQILGVTALFSPLLGAGVLYLGSWRLIFMALLAVGLITLLWSWRSLDESLPSAARIRGAGWFSGYDTVLRLPRFMLATLAVALGTATMFASLAGSSYLFIDTFGWSSTEFSILYAGSSLAFIGVCQINAWLLHRTSDAALLRVGIVIQLGASLVMLGLVLTGFIAAWNFAALWLILVANLGLTLGNAVGVAMRNAPTSLAGTASAVIGVSQFALSALVTPLGGLSAYLPLSFSVTTAAVATLAWIATILALRA